MGSEHIWRWQSRVQRGLCAEIGGAAPGLVLTVLLGLVLDIGGALHVYGLGSLMGQQLALGLALLLVGIAVGLAYLALWCPPAPVAAARGPDDSRSLRRGLVLLLLLAWLATAYNVVAFLVPASGLADLLLFGGGTLALVAALVWLPAAGWLVAGAAMLGSLVRLHTLAQVPIDPATGDMLPLVQGALANLQTGQSPYTTYVLPWEVPLTYLPVTWLAYLPPALVGLDIRLSNLAAELGIGGVLWLLAAGGPTGSTRQRLENPVLLIWAWVFVQPAVLNWSLATTAPIFWLLLCLLLVLVVQQRQWLAAVALGLCLAASSLVAVAAPFVVLHWLRYEGWRQTVRLVGVAGGVAAAWVLPFLLWSPAEFLLGTWQWFNDNSLYPRLRWEMDHTWARQTGFSGIFWRRNLVGLLKPLQALLVGSLLALFWWRGAQMGQLAPLVAAAFLLFMVFNPVLWPYLYNPALIAALVAVGAAYLPTRPAREVRMKEE